MMYHEYEREESREEKATVLEMIAGTLALAASIYIILLLAVALS